MNNPSAINPWNDRKNTGIFMAFFVSLKMLITDPRQFFQSWVPERSLRGSAVFLGLTQVFIVSILTSLLSAALPQYYHLPEGAGISRLPFLSFMIAPAITLLSTFIGAIVFHLAVRILRGQGGYYETFAVMAFISVSGLVMLFPAPVPVIKSFLSTLAFLWSTALMVIGFYHFHRLSWGRSVGAVLLGYLLSAVLGILLSAVLWALSSRSGICPLTR